jgi:hypothetical protein
VVERHSTGLENLVRSNLDLWLHLFQILCTYDVFYILLLILPHYFEQI